MEGNQKNIQLVHKTDGKRIQKFEEKLTFLKDLTEQQYSKHSNML